MRFDFYIGYDVSKKEIFFIYPPTPPLQINYLNMVAHLHIDEVGTE